MIDYLDLDPAERRLRELASQPFLRAAAAFDQGNAHSTAEDAPCVLCGAPVPAQGASYWGRHWRRHPGCEVNDAPGLLRAVVAARARWLLRNHEVSDEDAWLLDRHGHLPPRYASHARLVAAVYREGEPRRTPWQHVTGAQMSHLRKGIAALPSLRVKAGLVEVACEQGPCGWCGRRLSQRWTLCGHKWADGSDAPLCQDCTEVHDHYAAVDFYDEAGSEASCVASALSGVPPFLGERPPEGLRPFRQTVTDPGQGGEPWAHLDPEAVDAYRLDSWGRHPDHAPTERRDEAVAHWEQVLAEAEARRQAAEAKARAARNRYVF